MITRFSTGLVLSAALAFAAWLVFNNMLSATAMNIAAFVFLSCVFVVLTGSVTQKSDTQTTHQQLDGETTTLYVGNLPYKANEDAVKSFFGAHVPVQSVRLMKDKRTGKRKGYGFIEIVTNDVNGAINSLNDIVFQERTLKVRPAKDKVEG
jgi:RNA recognition motif-containing protein